MRNTVTAKIGLSLTVPEQEPVPLTADLYYSAEDPYAVKIAFHTGLDEPVEWVFARELLASGRVFLSGEGDVVIWPTPGFPRGVLNIEVSSSFGHAHFEAPDAEIYDFLKRVYALVPSGTESVDLDGLLSDILSEPQS
jgi:hypothetical protein